MMMQQPRAWVAVCLGLLMTVQSRHASARQLSHYTNGYAPDDTTPGTVHVESIWDPKGNPGMQPCATTEGEIEQLFRESLDVDFEPWRKVAPLNASHIRDMVLRNSKGHTGRTDFTESSMVLIYNNTWYYPWHEEHFDSEVPSADDNQIGVSLWLTATQYYFQEFFKAGNFSVPNVVFYFDVNDSGHCQDEALCPAPPLSLWKNNNWGRDGGRTQKDILVPYMVGVNHPLYNYPWQLKDEKAFFRGRPNWGASPKRFSTEKDRDYWSRLHACNLTNTHNDTIDAAMVCCPLADHPYLQIRPEEPIRDHAKHKFLLHLDGVTGSFRLSRQMHCDSVTLKEESHWLEYFTRSLRENVHYLAIFKDGPDDMLDVMARYKGRDNELKRLAWNAQQFALKFLCVNARMVFWKKALVEYKALFPDMDDYINYEVWPVLKGRIDKRDAQRQLVLNASPPPPPPTHNPPPPPPPS